MNSQTARKMFSFDIRANHFFRAFLLLAMSLLAGVAFADDFNDGVSAYKSGNYQQALSLFEAGAKKDDPKSTYALGLLYKNGVIVRKDIGRGLNLIMKSANQGFARAQNYLGVTYYDGNEVEQDYKEAFDWYGKAAVQGYPDAEYNLAVMYGLGKGTRQDFSETIKWLRKAAMHQLPEAQYGLGVMYSRGLGVVFKGSAGRLPESAKQTGYFIFRRKRSGKGREKSVPLVRGRCRKRLCKSPIQSGGHVRQGNWRCKGCVQSHYVVPQSGYTRQCGCTETVETTAFLRPENKRDIRKIRL